MADVRLAGAVGAPSRRLLCRLATIFALVSVALMMVAPYHEAPARAALPGSQGKIAFARDVGGPESFEIFVANPDGSGETRLTTSPGLDLAPSWSPDGSRVLFTSLRDGDAEIYVMAADGTGVLQLTQNAAFDADPSWSPDGGRIVFASNRDGSVDLYAMHADGTGVTRLTADPATDRQPSWSVGGRIAFVSNRPVPGITCGTTCPDRIWVMEPDGSGQAALFGDDLAGARRPDWSPDGSQIAFDHGGETIIVARADGSTWTSIPGSGSFGGDHDPAWAPDCTKLAFASTGTSLGDGVFTMNPDGTGFAKVADDAVSPSWQPLPPVAGCGGGSPPQPPPPSSDLALILTDTPDPVTVGSELTYQIEVRNEGPDAAHGVRVTDVLPSGSVLVSVTAAVGTCSVATTIVCDVGVLDSSAAAGITIVVRTTTAGTLTNTAVASADTDDPAPGNNIRTVVTTVEDLAPEPWEPSEYEICAAGCRWRAPLGVPVDIDLDFDGVDDHRAVLSLPNGAAPGPHLTADFRLDPLGDEGPIVRMFSVQLVDSPPDQRFGLVFQLSNQRPQRLDVTAALDGRGGTWDLLLEHSASLPLQQLTAILSAGGRTGVVDIIDPAPTLRMTTAFANGTSTTEVQASRPTTRASTRIYRSDDGWNLGLVQLSDVPVAAELTFGRRSDIAGDVAVTFPTLDYVGGAGLDVRGYVDPNLFGGDPTARLLLSAADLGRDVDVALDGNRWSVRSSPATRRLYIESWAQLRSTHSFSGCAPTGCAAPHELDWAGRASLDPLTAPQLSVDLTKVQSLTAELDVVSSIEGAYERFELDLGPGAQATVDYAGEAQTCLGARCTDVVGPESTHGTTDAFTFHVFHDHWTRWFDRSTGIVCRPGGTFRLRGDIRPHHHRFWSHLVLDGRTGGRTLVALVPADSLSHEVVELLTASLGSPGGVRISRYCG